MILTAPDLRAICPRLTAERAATLAPLLDRSAHEHSISTRLRLAAWIATLAHESGEFHYREEIWGPTPAQLRYEPPGTLARTLGNTQAGDGHRYRGRGFLMLTGRANYRLYGRQLNLQLEAHPEIAGTDTAAARIAARYWWNRGINAIADLGPAGFREVTRRVNGGWNGLENRLEYYQRALEVLPEDVGVHQVFLGDVNVTGHRLADARDGLVVNASRLHRTDVRAPWVRDVPGVPVPPLGAHRVFLNGVEITGARRALERLVVNAQNPLKTFIDRRN